MNQSNEQQSKKAEHSKGPAGKRKSIFLLILLFLGIIIFCRHEQVNTIDCNADIIASKPDVIMLGAWWCTYCYQAKQYFQQNNIHYCEYDVESTEEGKRLYQESGGGAVPVLLIGDYRLRGFSEQQVDAALDLLNK